MRVLVCGSRDYRDRPLLYRVLKNFHHRYCIDTLIEGGATGADTMAREWAECNGVQFAEYPADWTRYGHAAGPIRNRLMLTVGQPHQVLAFPKGELRSSRGTLNMVEQAQRAGVPVEVIDRNSVWNYSEPYYQPPEETEDARSDSDSSA